MERELLNRFGNADQIDWRRASLVSTTVLAMIGDELSGRLQQIAENEGYT